MRRVEFDDGTAVKILGLALADANHFHFLLNILINPSVHITMDKEARRLVVTPGIAAPIPSR